MSQEERLLQIITSATRKEGFLKAQSYRLILTDQRIIFAQLTKQMRKNEEKELDESLKGKGFKERLGAVMMGNKRVYEKYQGMDFESILEETPGNFFIPISMIKKIKTPLSQGYDDHGQRLAKRVTILTVDDNKHVLTFHYSSESDDAYHILKNYIK